MFVPLLVFVSTSGAYVPTTVLIKDLLDKTHCGAKGMNRKNISASCNVNNGLQILDLFGH